MAGTKTQSRKVAAAKRAAPRLKPEVIIRWRRAAGTAEDMRQAARDVAETVLGHAQRRLDAPRLHPVGELRGGGRGQSAQPLAYYLDDERVVGYQWSSNDESLALVTESGKLINGKTLSPRREERMFAADMPLPPKRKSARILLRPGVGGNPRRRKTNLDGCDPTDGLEEYGEVLWESAPGGASVGRLLMNPLGNGVIVARLSTEDENQRIVLQLDACMALVRQWPEVLRPRYALLAVNMSGMREVRPDRAGPPPAGLLERDDMLILDEWIKEGWVEHVVARGADRIARDVMPGETLLNRWARENVGLWLARHGRRMDYKKDRLLLRCEGMVSAEERAWLTTRCQDGLIEKGPMQGNGWLGTQPFGFYRPKGSRQLRPDPVQWPFILRTFELADAGNCSDAGGLSYRRVTEELAREGCPFDEERVRKILHDPIYAFGDFSVKVRGIPVPQNPIELDEPVPADRWFRVETLLSLRQGKTSRTPLGEFLFNYVPCVHLQCESERNSRDQPALIKGYILNDRSGEHVRRYRHSVFVPDPCKKQGRGAQGSFTWERDDLERPVIEAIRELAEHPEVLRALLEADRHTITESNGRLSAAQRQALESELHDFRMKADAATDAWVEGLGASANPDVELFQRMVGGVTRKIEALERRLAADEHAAAEGGDPFTPQREKRVGTFLDIMTVEVPDDAMLRALRARLFQRIIHCVEIDDSGSGPITLTLEGHIVPQGAGLEARDPISACGELLDAFATIQGGGTPSAEAELQKLHEIETALPVRADKAVSSLIPLLPSLHTTSAAGRIKQRTVAHEGWRFRRHDQGRKGTPAWRHTVSMSYSPASKKRRARKRGAQKN
jgi:hypothetical protein